MMPPPPPKAPSQMTDAELAAPSRDSQRDQERQHRELCGKIDSLDSSHAASQSELKRLVARIHRIDIWILIAGGIAAIAGVVAVVLEILLRH